MKKIVLACGAGAATSTLVAQKVATLLDANGYADKYEIVQCAISEAKDYCDEGADLLIATTVAPEGLTCPYVSGVPFMTGMNRVAAEKAVLDGLVGSEMCIRDRVSRTPTRSSSLACALPMWALTPPTRQTPWRSRSCSRR